MLCVSWRGYGRSGGAPSEAGLREDVRAAVRRARALFPGRAVALYGHSLGATAALCVAAEDGPDGGPSVSAVVADAPFTSVSDMMAEFYPAWSPYLRVRPWMRNRWDARAAAGRLRCRALFLAGERDSLVPPRMARELHDAATQAAARGLAVLAQATHETTYLQPGYFERVRAFLVPAAEPPR